MGPRQHHIKGLVTNFLLSALYDSFTHCRMTNCKSHAASSHQNSGTKGTALSGLAAAKLWCVVGNLVIISSFVCADGLVDRVISLV